MWKYSAEEDCNHWVGSETTLVNEDGLALCREDKPYCKRCKRDVGYAKAAVLTLLGDEGGTREPDDDL